MKRLAFPVLVLLLVLLLPALSGCPQDAGDGDTISSGNYGDNLPTLTGKVYTETIDWQVDEAAYKDFTNSGIVRALVWGGDELAEGSLADGSFTISITAEPGSNTFRRLDTYWLFSDWGGGGKVTINPPEARFAELSLEVYEEGTYTGNIYRKRVTVTPLSPYNDDRKYGYVDYWYVDKDATVTLGEGKGKDSNEWWDYTYEAGELKFRKGWNALYWEQHEIFSDEPPFLHPTSLSVEDPEDFYWVFVPSYEEE
jgi:hypothetical protein